MPERAVKGVGGLAAGSALAAAHKEVAQAEQDNVGVESAHRLEQTAESAVLARRAVRQQTYRKAATAEKRAVDANSKYLYRKRMTETPREQQTLAYRARQKRMIRKQYAAATRASRNTGQTVKTAANTATRVGGKLARFVAQVLGPRRKMAGVLGFGVFGFLLISSCMAAGSSFAMGIFGTVAEHEYAADDTNITGSSLEWTQWEYELQQEIDSAEDDHPGFREYLYELDSEIGHNPYEIIAFLAAMYGDFLYADVSDTLRDVFDEVYQLEFEKDGKTLIIRLTVREFSDVVAPLLEAEGAKDKYDAYMKSLGGKQRYGNPLGFPWYGSITSLFGYRDNPFGEKDKSETHLALDIRAPEGHPIYAVHSGVVVERVSGHSIYGNYLLIEDADGRQAKYAHCHTLLVSLGDKVKKGDQIAEVGTTGRSTGNHLHIEIRENGEHLNPLFLLDFS